MKRTSRQAILVSLILILQSNAAFAAYDAAELQGVMSGSADGRQVAAADSHPALSAAADTSVVGLSPEGLEVAKLLNIEPDLEKLISLNHSRVESQNPEAISDEELALKVKVLDKVMGESLEVRMISDRIDREVSWSYTGKDSVDAKRERTLDYLFALNFLQGGILGTVAGPVILHGYPRQSTELLLIASSVGLFLSTLSFAETRRGSKPIDGETNVLADVFSLPQFREKDRSELVDKFLNSVPPGSKDGKTRLQTLLERWKSDHYLRSTDEVYLQKLAEYQPPGKKYRETSGLLSSRIRMLFDTQYTVEELDQGLLNIMRSCQH